jgi:hypothetical protein
MANETETERERNALTERQMRATTGMLDLYAACLGDRLGQVLGCGPGGGGA